MGCGGVYRASRLEDIALSTGGDVVDSSGGQPNSVERLPVAAQEAKDGRLRCRPSGHGGEAVADP
jgi:hypothetical protein